MNRYRRYLLLVVTVTAAVVAISGCGTEGKHMSMAQLRAHLDKVPLPTGVALKRNDEQPRQSVAAGSIVRQYTYTGPAHPLCRTLLGGIAAGGYTITDIDGDPVTATTCAADPPNNSVTTDGGAVELIEPRTSVKISLDYDNTTVQLIIQDTGK